MSASSSPQPDAIPAQRRFKLSINAALPFEQVNDYATGPIDKDGSGSPARPSYSPVTPTLSHPVLANQHDTHWEDDLPSLPVSLDENPDAIALRATLSILQMQRQQSLNDVRKLERIKRDADKDPEGFVDELTSGKLRTHSRRGVASTSESDDDDDKTDSKFESLPDAQNIVRCPPIEWAKYNVVGEGLNTLHEVQQRYPGITHDALARGAQPQPYEIAAPYRPFVDKIEPASDTNAVESQYHEKK